MGTLATLKSRIAADLKRSDMTAHIVNAIGDAVDEYKGRRFYFNQTRDTFVTVAGTEFYTSGTDPEDYPVDVAEIDSLTITVNGRKYKLDKLASGYHEAIDTTTTSRGQPTAWSWYAQQIRLYPVPDAVYTVTLRYLQRIDVPATDGASNAWTTEAEQLIRACAKKTLYRDIIEAPDLAQQAAAAEASALFRLKRETNQLDSGPLAASGI